MKQSCWPNFALILILLWASVSFPELYLTADLSHWILGSERLLGGSQREAELMKSVVSRTLHIHARVGSTQVGIKDLVPTPLVACMLPESLNLALRALV